MRILIVDDSPLIRERLNSLIGSFDGTVVVGTASNAREALELAQSLSPDLVTLDLHMAGGNGFEFLERMLSLPKVPHVVVLTNYSNEQYRQRCLALGAVAFLDKSRQFGDLEGLIDRLRRPPFPGGEQ